MLGITRPRRPILGGTFAGVIDAIGAGVADFEPGQAVCGMTGTKLGTHAEYVAVPGHRVAHTPEGVTPDDAAGRVEDFEFLLGLVAIGEVTSVHDHIYDLEDIVEAHRRVDTGHKRGNVIVRPYRREEKQL